MVKALQNPLTQLIFISVLLLASATLFMTLNANGHWDFVLPFRGKKLLLLMVVGCAIGVSTLLFQTLTQNPILTPSILGFDSLYILLQTLLVFSMGAIGYTQINPLLKFFSEAGLLIGAAFLLFGLLMRESKGDLTRLILVGVIFGILFRSLNALLQRLIDPMEFAVVQTQIFAQFNTVKLPMLWIAIAVVVAVLVFVWQLRFQLDVLMLGQTPATGLGISYRRLTFVLLVLIALLISTSNALVGPLSPVSFFGLLVCALVNVISKSMRHSFRLPIVCLVASITLVLGQTVLEHVLGMNSVLSVIVEFFGGLVFLYLVIFRKTL